MMAIVHARGVARVYEESIEADLLGKYVDNDNLEDRVDELSDIETSQSIPCPIREGNSTLRRKEYRTQADTRGKRKKREVIATSNHGTNSRKLCCSSCCHGQTLSY